MKKIAEEILEEEISKEDAAREFASFIFDEIRKEGEDYPEDKHQEMIEKLVAMILNDEEPQDLNIVEPDLSRLKEFSDDLEKIINLAEKLEQAFPGADNLLYNALIEGDSENDSSLEMQSDKKFNDFNDEMEVEFHPDFMHSHIREDGSVEPHIGMPKYIEKKEGLNYQIKKFSGSKSGRGSDSFVDRMMLCKGRALKLGLVTKVSVCAYRKAEDRLKRKIEEFLKKFENLNKKGRSKTVNKIKGSRPEGIVEKSLAIISPAYDFINLKHVSLAISIYLIYKYWFVNNIIDVMYLHGLDFWPMLKELISEFVITIGLTYAGGSGILKLPSSIYKLRKYSKLVNTSCKKLQEIDNYCREKGIVTKLQLTKHYDFCLNKASEQLGISKGYAEELMKKASSSDNIIKISLENLMKFLEKNNFSEKNDLKLIISEIK